jgi:nitronate monooxygenase
VFSTGIGTPDAAMVRRCHERGIKVVAMVATVPDARAVAAAGVDGVVAQGAEAGGHRSVGEKPPSREAAQIGTMVLVPRVVDAVPVPAVASGGIADGRGLATAQALGAQGVFLGTRFIATREATVPAFWKKTVVETESDATTVTDAFSGLYARGVRNTFAREYDASGAPVLPSLLRRQAAQDIYAATAVRQNREHFPMLSGQSMRLIRDMAGAAEGAEAIVREAREVLRRLPERGRLA